jgi:hypothetical protein
MQAPGDVAAGAQTLAAIGDIFETRLHDSEDDIRKQARRGYVDVQARLS